MIRIDDLIIELPVELGHQAAQIARLVREKSARLRIDYPGTDHPGTTDTMALPDIELEAQANDNEIAEQIVSLIEQSLKERG